MALIGLFIIWGPQLGWGCKRESSQFQTSRGWHHRVCFSTNVYGLYARGDAETCLSSFHFYLRLRLPYLVKKCRTFKKYIYISNVLVNKLQTNLKEALARFQRLYYFLGMRNYSARPHGIYMFFTLIEVLRNGI